MDLFDTLTDYFSKLHIKGNAKSDLSIMRSLAKKMAHPERAFQTIHVAGTNGKGSVSTKIAKTLEFSGYKVGLYTSPHIESIQERFLIQGDLISKEKFCEKAIKLIELSKTEDFVSFFEIMTLIGFDYFREEKVDVAIIETGVGGSLDPTNIIDPLLSVITSISWDHMDILGSSLERIASQKAGVIKPNTPIIIGPRAGFSEIYERAKAMNAPLFEVKEEHAFYDLENTAVARLALAQLTSQFSIAEEALEKGLQMRPSCRFEKGGKAIFDVAHNCDGFKKLIEALDYHYPGEPFQIVIGLMKDKDLEGILSLLTTRAECIHLIAGSKPRAASVKELAEILDRLGYQNYVPHPSICEGINYAKKMKQRIVVCGSFSIMSEAKALLQDYTDCTENASSLRMPAAIDCSVSMSSES
jgi:dihydrofolate synthase/folylpolyglutamate synthase